MNNYKYYPISKKKSGIKNQSFKKKNKYFKIKTINQDNNKMKVNLKILKKCKMLQNSLLQI